MINFLKLKYKHTIYEKIRYDTVVLYHIFSITEVHHGL